MLQRMSVVAKLMAVLAVPTAILAMISVLALVDQPLGTTALAAVGFGGIVAAVLVAVLVATSTKNSLRDLRNAVADITEDRLPLVVAQMSTPELSAPPTAYEPVLTGAGNEIGALAASVNALGRLTDTVAQENAALLRKGISEIFVNLARRNQALLDRQIEFIDDLEAAEADPDRLRNLYVLDHLSTRMRRNADSLLVLAGADAPRKRGQPVQLSDVVRVAVGEIEHYPRIRLALSDSATVSAVVAADLAHLLSELMENATQFSAPDTPVDVIGRREADGKRFLLLVRDHGVGMDPRQLDAVNSQIANPPGIGLAVTRALGFTVVGRLAQRHGIGVQLRPGPNDGVDAAVVLPAALLDPRAAPVPARIADAPQGLPTLAAETPPPLPSQPPPPPPSAAARPAPVDVSQPARPAPVVMTTPPAPPPPPSQRDDAVLEGLTRRPARSGVAPDLVPSTPTEADAVSATPRRSPDQVRQMLSRYRGGLQKGRDTDRTSPPHEGPTHDGGEPTT